MTTTSGSTSPPSPRCSACSLSQFCLPVGIPLDELSRLDQLVAERIRLKKGEALYLYGDPLRAIFGVRFGSLKSYIDSEDGREQVVGLHIQGELLGLDAIADERHASTAVALEDSEVCVVRFAELEKLSAQVPSLQRQLHRLLSLEIRNDHRMLLSLGTMRAEQRLAVFLLNLSERLSMRGYAANEFVLRMSREEIGSYLGLTLETVSRLFSRLQQSGVLSIKQRRLTVTDPDALRQLAGENCQAPAISRAR
ncbi:fumarate/nitrate reduction transcriptional regulator Fnr [Pandoraea sp.]|uniref:fumarate/nitrate reduction transcriptional regulator Fnr n=1 Tax=Pandoraea sp. TaxID=1883445 RepID=UPI001209B489|nr:fumarate/nitrate reduction transcriptional regulator Fnr [Pandoraea sp.]TAL52322.1 MAG: fumarate/nitrate reduction transcriptional regulator Fnr [Pandoraea sp.]TAM16132.1 MAG: fumarate/nitrate reduction transcriptional regulator Fnr [Pandoraea sp.]